MIGRKWIRSVSSDQMAKDLRSLDASEHRRSQGSRSEA